MRNVFFFLTLLTSLAFGQEKKFTLLGVVTDCQTKLPLIDFSIKVVCSDGNAMEAKTDVNGKYILELRYEKLPLSCVVVYSTPMNPISCLYTGDKAKFIIEDSLTNNRIEDICLVNMGKMEAIVFPEIFFKQNTTQFSSKIEKRKIDEVAKIMKDNPTLVIQIDGYGKKDEAINGKIGLNRAKKVVEYLLKQGIDKNRIEIADLTNNALISIVGFRILRKDYNSPNSTTIK